MRRGTAIALGFAIGIQFASFAAWPAPDETLDISGGTTPWSRVIAPRLLELKTLGIELRFRGIGQGRGMLSLIDGKVPVAAVGDTLEDCVASAVKAARAENREIVIPGNLTYSKIGADEQVVIVHRSNPVTELSKAQLKAIATGRIANWKDVGGPDLPIEVVVTEPSLTPGQYFRKPSWTARITCKGLSRFDPPGRSLPWYPVTRRNWRSRRRAHEGGSRQRQDRESACHHASHGVGHCRPARRRGQKGD